MIRPAAFGYDRETAASNVFQQQMDLLPEAIHQRAVEEFDEMVGILGREGLDVNVFVDSALPVKPDAVFPNNWFSTHTDGTTVFYPMLSTARRAERDEAVLDHLSADGWHIEELIDLSMHEADDLFLEGTGSMVLDRIHRKAYACLSPRTSPELLEAVAYELDFTAVDFYASTDDGVEIYHTNVMMAVGTDWAVLCAESIRDEAERKMVEENLEQDGKEVVRISLAQMAQFAGNMVELVRPDGERLIVLSQSAHDALEPAQMEALGRHGRLLPIAIPTIETVGGGSVRCMIAEIFLPPKNN